MEQRKILFKAKRLDNGEWCVGDLIHKGNKTYIYSPHINDRGFLVENEQVDPSTVCQFTGLKDNDGKEIWEGDRIHEYYQPLCIDNYYVVVYSETDGMFGFENEENPDDKQPRCNLLGDLFVIGNKFDRKEGEK